MNRAELEALAGRDVHVVGLASTEGAAMVRFLWHHGVRRLTVHDFQPTGSVAESFRRFHVGMPREERDRVWSEIEALPVERRFGDRYLEGVERADALFVTQAWYLYEPNLRAIPAARDRGVPLHTMTELYFDLWPGRIVAVTGSNGKSTTSRLVESILRRTERRVLYAGNERRSVQVLDAMDDARPDDLLVLEVSNRQLIDLDPRPHVGVITNVLPNHLDEHGGSFEAYAAVKRKLVAKQAPGDRAVLNADDPASVALAAGLPGEVWWFSLQEPPDRGAWLADGRILLRAAHGEQPIDLGPAGAAPLAGRHNVSNIMAAALASWLAGADAAAVEAGLRAFRPLRHRIEFVWRTGGVDFYDDLNATTPQATLAALDAVGGPTVLIVGGDDKGLDFGPLSRAVRDTVRLVLLLPGPGGERLAGALGSGGPPVERVPDLRSAVARAVAAARPGDRVLLSPACPYFFRRHYLDGGQEVGFRALLRELAASEGSASAAGKGD